MFNILGFYKFSKIDSLKKNKKFIYNLLVKNNIKGSIIISKEGMNGNVAGKLIGIKNISTQIKKILI